MSSDSSALSDKEEWRVGGYVPLSPIGEGSFSKVMLARHLVTGAEVAVKIISRRDSDEGFQEVPSLKMLSHPNITKLFQVIDTEDQTFLVMEYVNGGHLLTYLRNNYPMAEEDARAKFRQMISAVEYCHRKGITHRDLKLENILVDAEGNIKVADFGFSTKLSDAKLQTFCGTLSYMAPEILKFEPYDGRKVDAWSLGVILYRMVTGKLPFEGTDFEEQEQTILSGHFHIPDSMSVECQQLLKKLLTVDPSNRISVGEIMEYQWVNTGYEEALRPYSEPPGGDIDPQVIEIMEKLGYIKEEIEDSVSQRKYDDIMATYMILQTRLNKMVGRTIMVRPCPASDLNIGLGTTRETLALGRQLEECASLPCHMESRVPSPPAHMATQTSFLQSSLESRFVSSLSLQVVGAISSSSPDMRGTTDTERMVETQTSSLQSSQERRRFIPYPRLQVAGFVPFSSLEMTGTTDTEVMEASVPSLSSVLERQTSSLQSHLGRRRFISFPSLQVSGLVPSSSFEMTGTTDTELMEASEPSPSSLLEMQTSSFPPSLETGSTIATDSRGSVMTISPGYPWSRTVGTQVSLDSTKSMSSASPASRVTSSLPSPGSRTTTSAVQSSISSKDVETPASPSGSSHGLQWVARRVARFFLKCFCCGPSNNKRHPKRERVNPI